MYQKLDRYFSIAPDREAGVKTGRKPEFLPG